MIGNSVGRFSKRRDRQTSRGWLNAVWLWAVILMGIAGCASIGRTSGVEQQNQATAAEVKIALARESGLSAAPLNVLSNDGVVTINGFVETEGQKRQVYQAASRVAGVKEVRLQLEVK